MPGFTSCVSDHHRRHQKLQDGFFFIDEVYNTYAKSERLVAVVAAVLEVRAVLELLFHRQLEYFLADGELPIDLFLG